MSSIEEAINSPSNAESYSGHASYACGEFQGRTQVEVGCILITCKHLENDVNGVVAYYCDCLLMCMLIEILHLLLSACLSIKARVS